MLAARQDIYITIAKISSELSGLDNPDNLENEFLQAEQLSIELEKDIDELLKTLENAKVNLDSTLVYRISSLVNSIDCSRIVLIPIIEKITKDLKETLKKTGPILGELISLEKRRAIASLLEIQKGLEEEIKGLESLIELLKKISEYNEKMKTTNRNHLKNIGRESRSYKMPRSLELIKNTITSTTKNQETKKRLIVIFLKIEELGSNLIY
ncbi:hypothetical protein J4216_03655 [Candidatus Woesearchaeota archaeon]|nr:hypothetical protein [Candidatus Woesearchaeota archaeon]